MATSCSVNARLVRSCKSGRLLAPDENRTVVVREKELANCRDFNLLELRAIVVGPVRGENDYVTQCVGCLASIGWVKDRSIGDNDRRECHITKDIRAIVH